MGAGLGGGGGGGTTVATQREERGFSFRNMLTKWERREGWVKERWEGGRWERGGGGGGGGREGERGRECVTFTRRRKFIRSAARGHRIHQCSHLEESLGITRQKAMRAPELVMM